jgi:sterol desaturase/sphingolipid hydroxylase (fatty acid hydroxylase superfamily)
MSELDITSGPAARLLVFVTILLAVATLEILWPRRQLHHSKSKRWLNNFSLSFVNTFLIAIIIPVAGVTAAQLAAEKGWGLLNYFQTVSWISFLAYLLIFDLTIYWQHRLYHRFNLLWRLHRVHHTDLDYDVSTGIRFHPLSILISTTIKLFLIVAMGPPAIAVLISEILLNATSMFNHSNVKIPTKLDVALRYFLVTPDMHRVHHSVEHAEHNKNFGFNFPWWDRIFASYQAQPLTGHEEMELGIEGYSERQSISLNTLLLQPFYENSEESDSAAPH